ncbi:hypothetical protein [Pedobacter sp.]|uniref:non-homologous end-joining DNA ligase LigD n=1 Tax=Pedobacter sp. TaxID=1411316 RepID=UPI003C79449D
MQPTNIDAWLINLLKKIFIDFSQNDPTDTLAVTYSVRLAKAPFVSAPIDWGNWT